ncbi:hypothetical protein M413DRAFT_433983 [Hebeloma cylindrosporum]|uniref:Uncharacterized protein n=1 Tax=Hebeloma cylindrosporum TaxID=76867 RepID=A0A0C2YQX8_HEBCY|nr:hypothetical protein M413DRAFT_433983 [Hebeloma cylindrosporum h7]
MALQLSMASPSTGELFTSTFDDFNGQGIVPTTPASASHPFLALWKEHLAELTSNQAGPYDTVIDAFVSLTEGSPTWREEEGMTESVIAAKMSGMRDLLSHHPPNVAVVSGVPELYSFHPRRPHFWHFICISEEYVKLWVDSDNRSDESARNRRSEKLALTALLKTSLDHEIGHWLFTLKTGRYSDAENISKLHSPPSTWSAQEEAGNFVEPCYKLGHNPQTIIFSHYHIYGFMATTIQSGGLHHSYGLHPPGKNLSGRTVLRRTCSFQVGQMMNTPDQVLHASPTYATLNVKTVSIYFPRRYFKVGTSSLVLIRVMIRLSEIVAFFLRLPSLTFGV